MIPILSLMRMLFADVMIMLHGRSDNLRRAGSRRFLISLTVTTTMDFIRFVADGSSASGHLTRPISIWSEISMNGKKRRFIVASVLKEQATGSSSCLRRR